MKKQLLCVLVLAALLLTGCRGTETPNPDPGGASGSESGVMTDASTDTGGTASETTQLQGGSDSPGGAAKEDTPELSLLKGDLQVNYSNVDNMTEKDSMLYMLRMLTEHKKYADTLFTDTGSTMSNTGYFGKGGTQKMRETTCYAFYYAFLYTEVPEGFYTEAERTEILRKSLCAIRYSIYTHNSVKKMEALKAMATDSDKWWGPTNWQSSLYANTLFSACEMLWDKLDDDIIADLEKVVISEGQRAMTTEPGSYNSGDTSAEENGWDSNAPAYACNLFPNHADAEAWHEAALRFAMNTLSQKLNENDTTLVDGKTAAEWITTWNLYDDCSLENHKILHPVYVMSPIISLADSAMAYAYVGRDVPQAFLYNVKNVFDNFCKKMVGPTGEWNYVNGCDWNIFLPSKIEAFAYVATMFDDPEAAMLESRSILYAYEIQAGLNDGRFMDNDSLGSQNEAIFAKRVAYAYMIHRYMGSDSTMTNSTWENFIKNNEGTNIYLDGDIVTNINANRFASMSWENTFIGLVTPDSNGYLENGFVTHPNCGNIVGNLTVQGVSASRILRYRNIMQLPVLCSNGKSAGFNTYGSFAENSGKSNRYISMTALPNNAVVVMDMSVAEAAIDMTSGYVLPLSFVTDTVSGLNKTINVGGEVKVFDKAQSGQIALSGNWVSVDEHSTLLLDGEYNMTFGDAKLSSGSVGSTLRVVLAPKSYAAGETINRTVGVIYSNTPDSEVVGLQAQTKFLNNLPQGYAGVIAYDIDGEKYYIINNFFGEGGTADVTLIDDSYGVAVVGVISTITKDTLTATLDSEVGSSMGRISKFISVGQGMSVDVYNSDWENMFVIYSEQKQSVKVTMLENGSAISKNIELEVGRSYMVYLDGTEIKTAAYGDSLPQLSSDTPKNLQTTVSGENVTLTWEAPTGLGVSAYIISRVTFDGAETLLGEVDGNTTVYRDTALARGVYKYRVAAKFSPFADYSDSDAALVITAPGVSESFGIDLAALAAENNGNLAYGKFASFYRDGEDIGSSVNYQPCLALDNNDSTFTVSGQSIAATVEHPVSFIIDLAEVYKVTTLVLRPRPSKYGPKDAKIYISTDGVNYTLMSTKTFTSSGNNQITFAETDVRYIKIEVTSTYEKTGKNYQIASITVK